MRIVEPKHEILYMPDNEFIIRHLELAARTCYKSEDQIKEGSGEALLKRITKMGHESVIEHAGASVHIICDRGITHELVRHRLMSFCLSGDTKIYRFRRTKVKPHLTIRELYERQEKTDQKQYNDMMTLRSVNTNGIIVPNKIKQVIYSGPKIVYEVKTKLGYTIKTSKDHIFFDEYGNERKLWELKVGNKISVNGAPIYRDRDWLYNQYHVLNNSLTRISELANCSYATIRKFLKKFNLTKELGTKPKDFKPWNKNLSKKDDPRVLAMSKKISKPRPHVNCHGANNSQWISNPDDLTLAGKRIRFSRYEKIACELCGETKNLENHHRDHDPENVDESNKMTLCRKCHKLIHFGSVVKHVIADEIVSIEKFGLEDTYDIEMEAPYHNFVANGILVHNSQSSSRYANFSKDKFGNEITVIRPYFWENDPYKFKVWRTAMEVCEKAYMDLVHDGATAQEARSVLPNSLEADIVITGNFRNWKHFFNLRCDTPAHPQMREITIPLLKDFYERCPVLFENEYNKFCK